MEGLGDEASFAVVDDGGGSNRGEEVATDVLGVVVVLR